MQTPQDQWVWSLGSWRGFAEAVDPSTLYNSLFAEVFFGSNGVEFVPVNYLSFTDDYPIGIINGRTYVDAPFSGGRTTYSLSGRVNAGCAVSAASGACLAEFSFGNSVRMTGLSIFDADGSEVLNPIVTSESGFDYVKGLEPHTPPALAPVPLPAGIAFLLTAIGGFAFARQRRSTPSFA